MVSLMQWTCDQLQYYLSCGRCVVCDFWQVNFTNKLTRRTSILVGKSNQNSAEFRDYSKSRPFEPHNFHRNFIFLIVKCVPANSEQVSSSSESSPAINSSNFMNRKTFPLYVSGKWRQILRLNAPTLFAHTIAITLLAIAT